MCSVCSVFVTRPSTPSRSAVLVLTETGGPKGMNYQASQHRPDVKASVVSRLGKRVSINGRIDSHPCRVLVADSDKSSRESLRDYLIQKGYEVSTLSSGASFEQRWRTAVPDVAVLDVSLPNCNMALLLPHLKASDPFIPVIMLARPGAQGIEMEMLPWGAEQFLPKPVDLPVLAAIIERSLEYERLRRLQRACRLGRQPPDPFIGESDAIRSLADVAKKAALTDNSVVLEGERGTGKRLLASWLHANSRRASQPFVELNRGSFLCRAAGREEAIGLFNADARVPIALPELAHRGTVMLAGIQSTDLKTQARLLRILELKASSRSGSGHAQRDVRLLATTRESLAGLVQAKRLRADLHSRLSGITLRVPSLRERPRDVRMLAVQILGDLSQQLGTRDFDLTRRASQALENYCWPANLRELRNVLERAVLLARSTLLTEADLQLGVQTRTGEAPGLPFRNLKEMERQYVERVLQSVGGRVQAAASILDVPRSSLYHKLKQYQFERTGMKSA